MKIDLKNNTVTMTGDDYNRLVNAWEENDAMINEMVMLKAKVNRLERENEGLKFTKKMHLGYIRYFSNNSELLRDEVKSLKDENKALRLQSDTYFEQWQALKDEIKVQPLLHLDRKRVTEI